MASASIRHSLATVEHTGSSRNELFRHSLTESRLSRLEGKVDVLTAINVVILTGVLGIAIKILFGGVL